MSLIMDAAKNWWKHQTKFCLKSQFGLYGGLSKKRTTVAFGLAKSFE